MRKIIIILCMVLGYEWAFGQVHNSASTLRPGRFSLGIAPILFVDRDNDLGLLINAGVGITRRLDLSLRFRLNDNDTYFGGDLELTILKGMPTISLATGMHAYNELGIDGTFNIAFPFGRVASLYGGLDMDVEFNNHDTYFPVWGFIGFEVMIKRHLGLLMEIDLGITDPAEKMFGIGFNLFF